MFQTIFYEIAAILLLAAVCGALTVWLRQPLIIGYICVGILVGPSLSGWVTAKDQIDLFSKMGITLLLFIVGLRLDLHLIRTLGPVALATGIGQVLFTSIIGYFLSLFLGLTPVPALYVAVALTFSSTIIIVKLLSDKREIDSLHGRIAVGFLIVQDILVIIAMIGLSAFGSAGSTEEHWRSLLMLVIKALALVGCVGLAMNYVLPVLLHHLARSVELLMLFAIAWAVSVAIACETAGFSIEVGAFLAGISLATTKYREAIGSRLVSLRDFLLLFFFVDLGAQMELGLLGEQIAPAIILSLFVLIGNPLIVMCIMGYMGYRKRTGFLAGLTVAQISEFSLILGALGVSLNHIGKDILGLITLVGLVTIGISTYMILYSHQLFKLLEPWLGLFERVKPKRQQDKKEEASDMQIDAILFGLGRYGNNIARNLQSRGMHIMGVDFDGRVVEMWQQQGLTTRYGDAEDPDFPATLPLSSAKWIISTISQMDINLALLDALRHYGYTGKKAVTAHSDREAEILQASGADLVLYPFVDAAKEAAEMVAADISNKNPP